MRVAVIGHTYVIEANRDKLRRVADRVEGFLLIAPEKWDERDFGERIFEPCVGIDCAPLPIKHSGAVRRYRFSHGDLVRRLKNFSPDILHVEAETGSTAALQAALIARQFHCALTQFVWENIPIHKAAMRLLARRNYRAVDHLFCGSTGASQTARLDGYQGEVTVVPQVGVNIVSESVGIHERNFSKRGFTAGYVGRLDEKKGVFDIIRALTLCPDVHFVFIGEGYYRPRLEYETAELGLSERVRFLGALTRKQTEKRIGSLDALLLPSRTTTGWKEQFGHVLIEAMALGVPVIGSNSGAIPEVIGEAGLIFQEGDSQALAHALNELCKNPETRRRLAQAGLRRVRELFTNDRIAEKMVLAWREVLSRRVKND